MAARVIYFTAGRTATSPELAEIAKINAVAAAPFEVLIRNAVDAQEYGVGVLTTDYVAGTPPAPYDNADEEEGPVYPVFDPDEPPVPVTATQVVLNHGDVLTLASAAGTVNVAIVAGVATYTFVGP